MCLAIPGIIEEIFLQDNVKMAKVNFQGIKRNICLAYLDDVGVDDFVLVHVGFALKRLTKEDFTIANKLISIDNEFND